VVGGLGLGGFLFFGCAAPVPRAPASDCTPHFPYTQGWLGGDAAYSVPLPPAHLGPPSAQRTLWLFGDSFVSEEPGATNREGAHFIHNSVAVSVCAEAGFEIEYFWQRTGREGARAFLHPPRSTEEDTYWWLFSGFMNRGALYLGLLEVTRTSPSGPLGLPFRLEGMKLARIDRPEAPPLAWRPRIAALSRSHEGFPGAAMVVHEQHVYFFSFHGAQSPEPSGFLARLPLDALDPFPADLTDRLQTWTKGNLWQTGFRPDEAQSVMADSATEMSVDFDPLLERWLAVYGFPVMNPSGGQRPDASDPVLSDAVYARTSEDLEGPWSAPRTLYHFPELSDTERAPGTFCYAAKAHPHLSPANALLITYVCNLRTLPGQDALKTFVQLQRDMSIYVPRVVVLPRPQPSTPQ